MILGNVMDVYFKKQTKRVKQTNWWHMMIMNNVNSIPMAMTRNLCHLKKKNNKNDEKKEFRIYFPKRNPI